MLAWQCLSTANSCAFATRICYCSLGTTADASSTAAKVCYTKPPYAGPSLLLSICFFFMTTEQPLLTMLLRLLPLLAAGIKAHPAGFRIQQGLLAGLLLLSEDECATDLETSGE
ncbi:unnamed protein product [Dibothriocephalus latus]|uniref:Uncharacterized protein n=1 Tax=Dibothriocephalus latus TaxID=60516 RepID=A0A3P6TCV5_DIBLA|nr:unnamed protein product [Dibothriocephalus latus]